MPDEQSPSPEHRGLRRRDFIALGSAALAVRWFEPIAFASEVAAAAKAPVTQPLSIGYLEGSSALPNLSRLDPGLRAYTVGRVGNTFISQRRVVPASSLPSGDPSLVGGALRLAVRGLYPAAASAVQGAATAVDLDVFVPALSLPAGDGAVFHAWSYRGLPAQNISSSLSFPVWPDWTSNLAVGLQVTPPNGKARSFHATFTLAAQAGQPRLQAGVYLLGLAPGVWDSEVDLPDAEAAVSPGLLSIVFTATPEGVHSASRS